MDNIGDRKVLGIILSLLGVFFFVTQDSFAKMILTELPPYQMVFFQFSILLIYSVVSLAWKFRKTISAVKVNKPVLQIARSLVIALEAFLFYLALQNLPLADLHAILSFTQIVVLMLSALILKEKISSKVWLATIISFIGVLFILKPGFGEISFYTIVAIFCVFLWSLVQIFNRMLGKQDIMEVSIFFLALFPALTAACLILVNGWVSPSLDLWIKIITHGGISILSFNLILYAYRLAPASLIQPFSYTIFFWASVLGWLFFDQLPQVNVLTGASLIIISGIYIAYSEIQDSRKLKAGVTFQLKDQSNLPLSNFDAVADDNNKKV